MSPQDIAARKLADAKRRVTEYTRKAKHATTQAAKWHAKVRHYEKRAAMTDAEIAAERVARETRKRTARTPRERSIALDPEEWR